QQARRLRGRYGGSGHRLRHGGAARRHGSARPRGPRGSAGQHRSRAVGRRWRRVRCRGGAPARGHARQAVHLQPRPRRPAGDPARARGRARCPRARRVLTAMLLWLKALHIIAVIAWLAGLLYLPRLFVYHCAAAPGSGLAETFALMEVRLLRRIMNPAMVAVWVTGPLLAWGLGVYRDGWLIAKVIGVALLTGYHQALGRWRKDFAAGRNTRSQRFYR